MAHVDFFQQFIGFVVGFLLLRRRFGL